MNQFFDQKGIGLLDIVISLLLSSLIMIALMKHYLNTKQQYHFIQTVLEEATELQLVGDLIKDSTRKAGFTPCLSIDYLMTLDQRNAHQHLSSIKITNGKESSLQINRMSEHFNVVTEFLSGTRLLATRFEAMTKEHPVLISDCYHAEVQNVVDVKHTSNGQIVMLAQPLAFEYEPPVYIGEWVDETFYMHSQAHLPTTLFYKANHAEELTSEVHGMDLTLQTHQGHMLLSVKLGLNKTHTYDIDVMVRG